MEREATYAQAVAARAASIEVQATRILGRLDAVPDDAETSVKTLSDATREAIGNIRADTVAMREMKIEEAPATDENALAIAIMSMPGSVKKDAYNSFAKYHYATADSMYNNCRKHIAAAGLNVWQNEIEITLLPKEEISSTNAEGKVTRWLWGVFEMGFQDRWFLPPPPDVRERVTLMVPLTGPQTFQAIRTFAMKYWLRSKCLLATGEFDDIDAGPSVIPDEKEDAPTETRRSKPDKPKPAKPKPDKPKPVDKKDDDKPAEEAGRCEIDPKAKTMMLVGAFPSERDKQRAVFLFIYNLVTPNPPVSDRPWLRDVINNSLPLVEKIIPEKGLQPLYDRINDSGLYQDATKDAQEDTAEQTPDQDKNEVT